MAGNDNLVYNSLERALSSDLNDTESIIARSAASLERYRESRKVVGDAADVVRNVVFGGLRCVPNGADVDVQAGVLGQDSATLAPLPGTYDSTFRFARLSSAITVAMPAPGADTYYVIEAQMVEVTTLSSVRDIFNTGTQTFVPTLVPKVRERRIQTQLLTGGPSAPAPSGGNWVPLAIVRRPAGGGAVASSDIIDVRPFPDGGQLPSAVELRHISIRGIATIDAASSLIRLTADVNGPQGPRCAVSPADANLDPTAAAVLQPALVLAANTWYYLYLAPWSALSLSPRYQDASFNRQGVLVLSDTVPDTIRRNSGAISLPAPYAVVNAPAGSAYLIGALLRNSGNTGWVPTQANGDTETFTNLGSLLLTRNLTISGAGVASLAVPNVDIATGLPVGARTARVQIRMSTTGLGGPTAFGYTIAARVGGGGVSAWWAGNCGLVDSVEFDMPLGTTGSLDITATLSPADTATITMTVFVVGYSW